MLRVDIKCNTISDEIICYVNAGIDKFHHIETYLETFICLQEGIKMSPATALIHILNPP